MKWLAQNWPSVLDLFATHIVLTFPAVLVSLLLAVPIGWIASRRRSVRAGVLGTVGAIYAVPSLPLFVLVPVVIGTSLRSPVNVVVVLTLYGLALLVSTATDAFLTTPTAARESATALGYSTWGRFWEIELPLAVPVLIAGLRVVVVSTVSLATVGALVGVGSLGSLLTDGFQRGIVGEIVTGVVATVVLALLLDGGCVLARNLLAPWSRKAGATWTS
jgi:osmoprotectant transport system permease protein